MLINNIFLEIIGLAIAKGKIAWENLEIFSKKRLARLAKGENIV